MLTSFLSLFFPNYCVVCNEVLKKRESFICLSCELNLPFSDIKPSIDHPISQLFSGKIQIENCFSLFQFQKNSSIHKILHAFKYEGKKDIGIHLGRLIKHNISGFINDVDLIIPVPLHPKRYIERGYNQSEILAQSISNVIVDNTIIERIKNTATQTKMSKTERIDNMENAFELCNMIPEKVKHVLIIDDVVTTGSTIVSLCQTLLKDRDLKFSVVSIAYA